MKKLNTILIGGGHQSRKEHLPALIFSDLFELIGIVEPDQIAREEIVHILDGKNIPIMERIEELDRHINKKIDMAVVSVPHDQYLPIINFCAQRGVHILKEKPFARNEDEAKQIYDIAKKSKIKIMTSFQRRFHPIYQNFKVMLKQIGEITSVEASYTLGSKKPNSGWRSDIKKAGGGVMMDMGYHMIDLIFWYIDPFKVIDKSLTINRKGDYNTDDTSFITFEVGNVKGFIFVSCIYPIKNEQFIVIGSKGSAILKKNRIERYNLSHELVEHLEGDGTWAQAMQKQLEYFYEVIVDNKDQFISNPEFQLNNHVKVMSRIYEQ
ncbi:MAG: hypothetical protein A2639_02995 [Candidatus Staskawiczbacteria bacterium RIFCSPHIGHO2_01_FULL_34_27]|uniref:Dehydrogenase n=2 Tax=Candidatus Staskawicziibacteriota TaxID=1817916 RepID=A0A1G2HJB4_9BACT|nr:MAG: putative dehydrogenase [Parcubacteria group bacterium GW2011_GWA2_33_14]OGZ62576.1 MAG: hypothetical protein A2639_02995 [Candidatus Staskawiczbacteria bacterium RIFCSPHIGHO2_01_FULL_34_27]OGZ66821.1 MAG: hypothetical protein A3D34_00615 [Candidatus Staskawiczbacteria bacterium RIFCSPHIGHO2_02_FULL_33_16]OGZ70450.1 MAG: hypothetical protein A2980_03690 [Candidatus Staskawiczbacteria bacterium RIFCSPLOWO2_01_FULL_33_13]